MALPFFLFICVWAGLVWNDKLKNKFEYYKMDGTKIENTIKPSEKVLNRVNWFAKSEKLDEKGWIKMAKLTEKDFRYINVELKDGKVICNEGNNIVPIKVKSVENASKGSENNAFLLHVDYELISSKSKTVNPLPVLRKGWEENWDLGVDLGFSNDAKTIVGGRLFGEKFEGYLVCYREGDEALLVPKYLKPVSFKEPEWTVAVDISMYRNPLATFGRQYKITILDNVNVLENGKKSFIWPLPLKSMADAYVFHKMVEKKKKKMCFLTRDAQTFDINLYCEDWGFRLKKEDAELTFLITAGLANLGLVAYSSSVTPSMTDYKMERSPYRNIGGYITDVEDVERGTVDGVSAEEAIMKKKLTGKALFLAKLNWYVWTNLAMLLIFGGGMAMWSIGSYFRLWREVKQMDKALEKADFIYPWSLQTPQKIARA